jgi:alpha-tubulin suppressor-like RCC1 family protein
MFGRNERASLGVPGREYISENAPLKLSTPTLPGASPKTRFVYAACGRNHSLLIGSEGQVWATGANNLGQCGQSPSPEVQTWQQVKGTFGGGKVVKAVAGISFSIVLTEQGRREWRHTHHFSSSDAHFSVCFRKRRARSVGQRKDRRTHHHWKQNCLRRT